MIYVCNWNRNIVSYGLIREGSEYISEQENNRH
jgi:hypothetical protein